MGWMYAFVLGIVVCVVFGLGVLCSCLCVGFCYFDVLCCWLFNYLLVLLVGYCLWFSCGLLVFHLLGSVICVGWLWFVVVVIVVCWCCLFLVVCLLCNSVVMLHLIVCFAYWFVWFNYFFGNCVFCVLPVCLCILIGLFRLCFVALMLVGLEVLLAVIWIVVWVGFGD